MKRLLTCMSILLFLNGNAQKKIVAAYSAISCPCAQWKVKGEKENIYLSRENKMLPDANSLWDGRTLPFKVVVKGRFQALKGVPEDFTVKGNPEPAKIFVYSEITVLK